jgi:hypothetical protein
MTAPEKLQIAAIISAERGESERVDTDPAMALGASVQPLTRAAANIRALKKYSIYTSEPCYFNPYDEGSAFITSTNIICKKSGKHN